MDNIGLQTEMRAERASIFPELAAARGPGRYPSYLTRFDESTEARHENRQMETAVVDWRPVHDSSCQCIVCLDQFGPD